MKSKGGRHDSSGMEHKGPFHGSPKETHTFKPGGGYDTKKITIASGPGKAAMRVKTDLAGGKFEGGKSSGKAPGMKKYSEE